MVIELEKMSAMVAKVRMPMDLQLLDVRIQAEQAELDLGDPGTLVIPNLELSIVISEASLNIAAQAAPPVGVRDLEVAVIKDAVRVTGKKELPLGVGLPFSFTAAPEIVSGSKVRLDPRSLTVVGAQIPGFGLNAVAERINESLSNTFDMAKLPFAGRLTELRCDPGRLVIKLIATVELRTSSLKRLPMVQSNADI